MYKRTKKLFKKSVIATAVASVVVSAVGVPVVLAQDNFLIEEVIVTASKRSRTLQDTPIAVNVTTSQDIEQANIHDLGDLQTLVPTLRVNNSRPQASNSPARERPHRMRRRTPSFTPTETCPAPTEHGMAHHV